MPLSMPILQIPTHSPLTLSISMIICFSMTFFAFYKRILDIKGALAALALGLVISIFSDIYWLLALICLLITSTMVTRVKFNYKKQHGLAEGKIGERGINNVIAIGFIPGFIALFSYHLDKVHPGLAGLLFLSSLSIAAADTFASEVGVLSKKVILITSFKNVPPGTDGGISMWGEISALLGAFLVSLLGFIFVSDLYFSGPGHLLPAHPFVLVACISIGWLGCQVDSVLGALFQYYRDLLSNELVNFLSIAICVLTVWVAVGSGLLL
jgi:uncharacterized protein (TIGR00297 family)